MSHHSKEEKPTVEMCYHKGDNRDPCVLSPTWKLKSTVNGYRFKVCDTHLAWCIRFCGYPALVDKYEPDSRPPTAPTGEYPRVTLPDAVK